MFAMGVQGESLLALTLSIVVTCAPSSVAVPDSPALCDQSGFKTVLPRMPTWTNFTSSLRRLRIDIARRCELFAVTDAKLAISDGLVRHVAELARFECGCLTRCFSDYEHQHSRYLTLKHCAPAGDRSSAAPR